MHPRVIAILVARRGGDALAQTLDALSRQSRRPDLLVVVDAAGDDDVTAQLAASNPTQFVTASPGLGFGELVHRGLGALPAPERSSSPYGGVAEWLWLLRHDTTPDPRALERLLAAVEIAPSVAVAGAKQMDAAHPTVIAEYGETLTRWGASIAIAERELDQAQHDRTSDVLAMGEAAMLVRRTVWNAVEGMDPALPSLDAALDLCVRIRLAGHRVVGVPSARVFVHEGTALAGKAGRSPRLGPRPRARLRRTAQLHRRLAYAPALVVPLHWLSLLPLAVLRALGQLLRKRPTYVAGEFSAALAVALGGTSVPSARRRIARGRTMGWAVIAPLRMPHEEVRRRRAIARDAALSAQEDSRPPRPGFAPGGALVVALAALLGAVMLAPLLGAPALLGGALAPLAPDLTTLLASLQRSLDGAADPFAFVLALLGLLTPWQPSLSLVLLWFAALPLAALGAWWASVSLVRRAMPAAVVAALWALSPPLLSALTEGRPAAVVAHLALPWLVAAAARAPRSWSATAVAGLTAAVVAASAPSLVPALIVAWIAWMVANPRRFGRLLTLPVPALALLAPLVADQLLRGTPLGLLADPGVIAPGGGVSPSGLLLGWPSLPLVVAPLESLLPGLEPLVIVLVLAALMLPLALLALLGLALPQGRRGVVPLVLAALGLLTAWLIADIALVTSAGAVVTLDVGPALSLYGLGLVLAAGVGLDALAQRAVADRRATAGPALAAAFGTVIVLAAIAAATPALGAVIAGTASVEAGEPRTLPAIVAAEAASDPRIGTLVLTPRDGALAARIDRGAGVTMAEQRTIVATAGLVGSGLPGTRGGDLAAADGAGSPEAAALQSLAELVGNLAAPSGRDLTAALDELDLRFVLLEAPPAGVRASAAAAALAALDGNPILTPIGDADAGRLWRVVPDDDTRAAIADRPAGTSALLGVQLSILALALLLAVPTSLRPRRARVDGRPDGDPARTFEAGDDDD